MSKDSMAIGFLELFYSRNEFEEKKISRTLILKEIVVRNNMADSDSRPIIGYISEAWSDIRSFLSNIWQVATIGLTVIALSTNVVVTSLTSVPQLDFAFTSVILLLTSIFAFLVAYIIGWLKEEVASRVTFLEKAEIKLNVISEENEVISGAGVYGKTGPLSLLIPLFNILGLIFAVVSIVGFGWIGIPLLIALAPLIPPVLVIALMSAIAGFLLSYLSSKLTRRIRRISKVERTAYESYSYSDFEREMIKKLKDAALVHNVDLEPNVRCMDKDSKRLVAEIDAILKLDKKEIPVEITNSKRIHDRRNALIRNAVTLKSKYGVLIQRSIDYEIREYGDHSILIIGSDNDFDLIFKWLQESLKKGE